MTDQMPDFDSMSPEEIMAWMEALAVRQGATEGIINDVSNIEVAEIDPSTVDIADEYIPYGMDPEVWAKKKAAEDAAKAERIAAMKAEKEAKAGSASSAPAYQPPAIPTPPPAAPTPPPAQPAGLDFMAELVGGGDSTPDLPTFSEPSSPTQATDPLDGLDFLSNLGQAAAGDMGDLGSLDFSGLDALGMDEPASGGMGLDWLENIVSDSKPVETISDELAAASLPDTAGDSLSETAVGRILDDPMDWLSDFSEDKPMAAVAPSPIDAKLAAVPDTPTGDPDTDEIRAALKQGSAEPDDVRAWMDSMLDKGLNRTDVVDEDEVDDSKPLQGEIPDWLVSQVGAPPDLAASAESLADAEAEADLPEWLTAPVSEEQTAEFEAIFTEAAQDAPPPAAQPSVLDNSPSLGLLDTSAIQVEMNDPWVEAFELERSERMGETDQLAGWYSTAQSELISSTDSITTVDSQAISGAAANKLQPANLQPESDLPAGAAQSVPPWLGGDESAAVTPATHATSEDSIPDWLQTETLEQSAAVDDDSDLPAWLRPQVEEVAPVEDSLPDWLDKRVVTDEFTAMPDTPVVIPVEAPIPPERPAYRVTAASVSLTPSEIAQLLNSARGSLKMGDVGAMVSNYEALIRSHAALEEVANDLSAVSRDPAHKSNPAVLRVYGDVLMRQGKLQAALDTYRAALNLL